MFILFAPIKPKKIILPTYSYHKRPKIESEIIFLTKQRMFRAMIFDQTKKILNTYL